MTWRMLQGKANMSTSGLSTKDHNALALILQQIEALTPARAYMGGAERTDLDELQTDVRRRLDPVTVDSLKERAAATIEHWRGQHDWARKYLNEAGL